MLNTLRKIEDHVRWIYLTTVLNMGELCQRYARIVISQTEMCD